jgi:hypothetical protein
VSEVRSQERRPVALPGNLKTTRGRQHVAVSDLSVSGCKVDSIYVSLAAGENVTLRPRGLQALAARVVWCSGTSAGLLFDQALHPAVLENLCRLHPDAKKRAMATSSGG